MLLLLALAPACAFAAAPVTLDRDVNDISHWLQPKNAANPNERSIELANPKNERIIRIITLDTGSGGIFRFLGQRATSAVVRVAVDGGEARIVDIGGAKAVSITLSPPTAATITIIAKGDVEGATWSMWKPNVLEDKKRSETLIVGIFAGATLVMALWLAGLALYHGSWQPGWAAISLGALVVLLLTGSVITVSPEFALVTGAVMIASRHPFPLDLSGLRLQPSQHGGLLRRRQLLRSWALRSSPRLASAMPLRFCPFWLLPRLVPPSRLR
ncbi:MAG: hypothetical protein MZV49_11225 [Rhodopseudomonas palustris]|nr:hypothetical protein [Rhodopseudomonas palustris]